jgi:hypothetical protein
MYKMDCDYCKKIFSNKSSLKTHQTSAKYCLKIQGKDTSKGKHVCDICGKDFNVKFHLQNHIFVCQKNNLVLTKYKEENQILKEKINILQNENELLRQDKKELQERYADLSITAVKRPVNNTRNIQINNFIQKMEPLKIEDIKETVPMLTLDHHVKGPEGYAEYALEFPFKNKIVCVDVNRNKIKYKDGEGNVIEDLGFQKMMTKLCESLKDRSFSLSQEHYEKLSEEFTEEELNEYNCMNTALAISRYANGRENEFCNKLIKLISKGSAIK